MKDTSMEITPVVRRFRRKKLLIWFGVAVALHTALLLVFFLTPSMRLKWNPPPQDWVPVVSLPKPEPAPTPAPVAEKPAASAGASPRHRVVQTGETSAAKPKSALQPSRTADQAQGRLTREVSNETQRP
jgi:hypothetical protein